MKRICRLRKCLSSASLYFLFLAVLALAANAHAGSRKNATPLPLEALKAKTIAIVNKTGKAVIENGADDELAKWGRFTLVDDPSTADITLVIYKPGVVDNQKDTPKTDGTCCDQSYSSSFTFGTDMKAYLKGRSIYFYSTDSSSSAKHAGHNLIKDFRKNFPAN